MTLDLTDAGFDASVLCEFRARLVEQHAEKLLLEKMLTVFQQKGWLKARGRQRTDSRHVLSKIRALNRVLCVWETMRFVLGSLAVVAPEWLHAHSQPEWVERYGPRSEDSRSPLGEAERQAFAEDIGRQGAQLLADLFDPATPQWLRQVRGEWNCCGRCGDKIISWTPTIDNRKNEVIKIKFSTTDCQVCPSRSLCTQSSRHTRRTVTIRPQEQYQALKQRRESETTKEFTQVYAKRAGFEGTISQAVWAMGMRRSRYIGQEKTHLQHLARLPPSIWFAVWHGSMAFLVLRLAVLLLLACMTLPRRVRQRNQV